MQNHEPWLKIARDDLLSARALLKLDFLSNASYLCEQSAEKSLKAYLVFKKQSITKTHDLLMLLERCMQFDRDFGRLFDAADYLNPFSTKFRYPSEYNDVPGTADIELAVKHAQRIMNFVKRKITGPLTGQIDIFDGVDVG